LIKNEWFAPDGVSDSPYLILIRLECNYIKKNFGLNLGFLNY